MIRGRRRLGEPRGSSCGGGQVEPVRRTPDVPSPLPEAALLVPGHHARKLPLRKNSARGGEHAGLFVVELEITNSDADGALPGGGPRHDCAVWLTLSDPRRAPN